MRQDGAYTTTSRGVVAAAEMKCRLTTIAPATTPTTRRSASSGAGCGAAAEGTWARSSQTAEGTTKVSEGDVEGSRRRVGDAKDRISAVVPSRRS